LPGDACANPLRDPWEGTFGITVNSREDPSPACPCSHAVRLFFATIGPTSDPHTFVVAVVAYAPDPMAEPALLQAKVQPILDSVRVPDVVVDN